MELSAEARHMEQHGLEDTLTSEEEPYEDSGSDAVIPSSDSTEGSSRELDLEADETEEVEAEMFDQGNQNDEDECVDIEQNPVLFNFTGRSGLQIVIPVTATPLEVPV